MATKAISPSEKRRRANRPDTRGIWPLTIFETRSQPLAPRRVFAVRMLGSLLLSSGVVALSLGLGTWGYHIFGRLSWLDSLLNAAMILTGMGPVAQLESSAGKLFAVFYCLFSGIVFLSLMAIILTPIYHRVLHRFHLADEQPETS